VATLRGLAENLVRCDQAYHEAFLPVCGSPALQMSITRWSYNEKRGTALISHDSTFPSSAICLAIAK